MSRFRSLDDLAPYSEVRPERFFVEEYHPPGDPRRELDEFYIDAQNKVRGDVLAKREPPRMANVGYAHLKGRR